jgi:ATP-dependent DNA ligase
VAAALVRCVRSTAKNALTRQFGEQTLWPHQMPQVLPTGFVPPCLPTFARIAPEGSQWAYEIKHDGFRFICRRDGDRVRVFSRHGRRSPMRLS